MIYVSVSDPFVPTSSAEGASVLLSLLIVPVLSFGVAAGVVAAPGANVTVSIAGIGWWLSSTADIPADTHTHTLGTVKH